LGINLRRQKVGGLQSILNKLLLIILTILGSGYVLTNISMAIMLEYRFLQLSISSVQNVLQMSSILMFMLASIVFGVFGVLLIIGEIKYYRGSLSKGIFALGALLLSFYLLCLGIGNVLLTQILDLATFLFLTSPIVFMAAIAALMSGSRRSRIIGSILGLIGAALLAFTIFPTYGFGFQIFKLTFPEWNVPFPSPFMSLAVAEGPALILASIGVLVHSTFTKKNKRPATYMFFLVAALVYGVGLFVGSLILSLSFLDQIWKAPWVGPLYNAPSWVVSTVIFWSASLIMLVFGGILLILASYAGFYLALSAGKK
jgi:hypothetical protein